MSRSTGKSGCASLIGKFVVVVLILGAIGAVIEKIKTIPTPILIGVLVVILALVILIIVLRTKKKRKKSAAENDSAVVEKSSSRDYSSFEMEPESERPAMPKASIRVVSSSSSGGSGIYDYEYDNIGIYRPDSLALPMPPLGATLEFENDPDNEYDSKAIKAVWNGQTVGWLYRKGKREMIRDWIDKGWYYTAEVTSNDPELKFWIGMDRE